MVYSKKLVKTMHWCFDSLYCLVYNWSYSLFILCIEYFWICSVYSNMASVSSIFTLYPFVKTFFF
jgi:hypothetical protein